MAVNPHRVCTLIDSVSRNGLYDRNTDLCKCLRGVALFASSLRHGKAHHDSAFRRHKDIIALKYRVRTILSLLIYIEHLDPVAAIVVGEHIMLLSELFRIDGCTEAHHIGVKIIHFFSGTVQKNRAQLVAFRADTEVAPPILGHIFGNVGLFREPTLACNRLNVRHRFSIFQIIFQVNNILIHCVFLLFFRFETLSLLLLLFALPLFHAGTHTLPHLFCNNRATHCRSQTKRHYGKS